jgi:hypothetical protein
MVLPEQCTRAGVGVDAGLRPLWSYSCFGALIAAIAVYYLFLLSNGTLQLFAPEMLDKAYNSMLVHLLHGEFNVDPTAIGFEALTRNGKTYAYFGVFPALLRLVAMPFTDIARAELARLSCLTALVVFAALQLRALLAVHNSLPAASRRRELLCVMVAATLLSGPQVYILGSASIYHEAILWAAAMASGFNLIVLRATFTEGGFRGRDMALLAILAGLAINTRPSIGLDLYLGTVLLLTWAVWCRHAAHRGKRGYIAQVTRPLESIWLPIAILGLLAAAAGGVNFERWGDPFTFADFRYYGEVEHKASRAAVFLNYGEFNLGRIWIGALYYATGLPWLLKSISPYAEFLRARVVAIEAPPLTPLLTNPITVILAAIGVYRACQKSDVPGSLVPLRLTLLGHTAPVIIVCGFFYFTLRYRFDFTPFMTLASLLGYRSACLAGFGAQQRWRKRLLITGIGLLAVGIAFSHYVLLMHKAWSMAAPMQVRLALSPFLPSAYLPVPSPLP